MAEAETERVPDWCEVCRRHWDGADLGEAGPGSEAAGDEATAPGPSCPQCGEPLVIRRGVPWTYRFMLVATVIYLGYRAYQGIGWLVHHA